MKPSSDVFRPRLPIDPFVDIDVDQEWFLFPESSPRPPSVILVLGVPSQAELHHLLASHFLSDSLILIATHAPPRLALHPMPMVRILRLPFPADELNGVHLVNLFERAGHIVEQWRTQPSSFGDSRIAILTERFPGGDFTQVTGSDATATQYPSPASSFSNVRHSRVLSKRKSVLSDSTHSLPSPTKTKSQSSRRTFDAIMNFLPASSPEKDILKYAILVTSLSVPFLTCTKVPPLAASTSPSKRRFSSFLRSRHVTDDSNIHGAFSTCTAHLIHILSASRIISPASSRTSLSSHAATSSPGYRAQPSSRTPSFISRQPTSRPSSTSSSTFYIPSSHSSSISAVTHLHPHYQPISAPMQSRVGSQASTCSSSPSLKKPNLARTIEQFLLSFAHPLRPVLPTPTNDLPGFQRETVPYILAPGVIGSPVQGNCDRYYDGTQSEIEILAGEGRLTVGEAILLGLLDPCAKGENVGKSLKSVAGLSARAWIGDARQVVLASKGGVKARGDALAPSLMELPPLAVPIPALGPSGREREQEGSVVREDGLSESSTLTPTRYSPPTTSIKKPPAVVPKVPVFITPPPDSDIPVDHAYNGLATPPDSSMENGGTEYETCETYTTVTSDFGAHLKTVSESDSYDPYQAAFLDPNWSSVDTQFGVLVDDVQPTKTGILKGFKRLSKAFSISGKAASPISSMAMSTIVQRRNVLRRERDVFRPVVV